MSGASELKYRLHSAFVAQLMKGASSASLEILHQLHGWRKVFGSDNNYIMINNPLILDSERLANAVNCTLAECDSWLSEEEKKKKEQQREKIQREEVALARRGRFYVL